MSFQGRESLLILKYKFCTDAFIVSEETTTSTGINGAIRTCDPSLRYTSPEFTVERQPGYPEIPESHWKLSLYVCRENATVDYELENTDFSESPHGVFVQYLLSSSSTPFTIRLPPAGAQPAEYLNTDSEWPFLSDMVQTDLTRKIGGSSKRLQSGRMVYLTMAFQIHRDSATPKSLLDAGKLTDCTLLSSDGRTFPAHRAILAAASPVFLELFDKEQEHPPSCYLIDLSADLLEALVQYLYDRMPMRLAGRLVEFWMVAELFEMPALQCACQEMMLADVKKDNAMEYFDFAREHGLGELQRQAAECIGSNL
ncbi:uncharacterized protein LOC129586578 [Paramacrobiotus metropolitanus]|uniref:uncharacterized protein LOC129586578 n=1 Tax=Paramacrobiotus metropolitanus TaxID=2943436 RepID=UPI00244621F4|nr:uncharacterized protein LOC129586578 [Paramacrobiotus metropolitanus]